MEPARQAGSERRRDCDPSFENALWRVGVSRPLRQQGGPSPAVGGRDATNCGLAQKNSVCPSMPRDLPSTTLMPARFTRIDRPGFEGSRGLARSSAQDAARDAGYQQRFDCRNGTSGARGDRADLARRRRTPPAAGNVYRPRWLDRALDQTRPRGDARCDRRLSKMSPGSTVSSPSRWATGCSSISAIPGRTTMTPSARYGLAWRSPKRSASCASKSRARCTSGWRPAWS
jgi:hypothetical protein